jgi:hypothetical protein
MLKCLVSPIWLDWDHEVVSEGMEGEKFAKLAFGATVYHIWKLPNNIKFCSRVNLKSK